MSLGSINWLELKFGTVEVGEHNLYIISFYSMQGVLK